MISIDRTNAFVLNLLFDYCSGMCNIIQIQRCRLIQCNILGQLEFFYNNHKFTNKLQFKEISKLKFYLDLLHCRLSLLTQPFYGFIFCAISRLFSVKAQSDERVKFSLLLLVLCYLYKFFVSQMTMQSFLDITKWRCRH